MGAAGYFAVVFVVEGWGLLSEKKKILMAVLTIK